MHADTRIAVALQEIDRRIGELRAEIATLPRQIAEIEKALDTHVKQLDLDHAAVAANQRERKAMDAEIQTQQQKISKLRDQMGGGKISNEQYRAFQNEIEFCEKSIRKAEDRILELMSESEPLERAVRAAEAALAAEKKVVEAEKAKALAKTSEDKAEGRKLMAEREALTATLSKPVLTTYERLHSKMRDGIAVAEVIDGICQGCRLTLRPQLYEEVKYADKVVFCESCKRIIYSLTAERVEDNQPSPAALA